MNISSDLRRTVRGRVLTAADAGFDQARKPWNLAIEQKVRAVVHAADAADVAAVVRYARLAGLTVTGQPSGHGATPTTDDVIVLRTAALDQVEIDPDERTARVGAGVQWGSVLAQAGRYGLTGLAGSSPVVSVTGYTLGGGLSWFGRKYGFAADSVRAFDIVDADGVQATLTASADPDLFWALRGGGGDFAMVTAIEFDLLPAPRLYGGRMLWPAERAPRVLDAYREITASAPDELTAWYNLFQVPGTAPTVAVDSAYLGESAAGQELLAPLAKIDGRLADTRAPLPVAALGSITAEPTAPSAGIARGELLTDLGTDVASVLLDKPIDPLLEVQIRHLGGALARPNGSATEHLDEPYCLYLFGVPSTSDADAAVRARQSELATALVPHTSGRKPFNYLAPGERAAAAFGSATLDRLRSIKRARDPQGVFRSNFPVLG